MPAYGTPDAGADTPGAHLPLILRIPLEAGRGAPPKWEPREERRKGLAVYSGTVTAAVGSVLRRRASVSFEPRDPLFEGREPMVEETGDKGSDFVFLSFDPLEFLDTGASNRTVRYLSRPGPGGRPSRSPRRDLPWKARGRAANGPVLASAGLSTTGAVAPPRQDRAAPRHQYGR
jgi:hypothetical protein